MNSGEAAPIGSIAVGSVQNASELLSSFIKLDAEKKAAKKILENIETQISEMKEKIKDLFMELGVNSIKSNGKNIHIAKQIWAGITEDTQKEKLASALIALDMDDYISCNTQKLSSYVREIIQEHPEFVDSNGEVIASPEEIVAVLPEPFNTMVKVTEKVDIRVRNK